MMATGCDTAIPITNANVQTLINQGFTFVGRYLGILTPTEKQLITKNGLFIVSLYEADPTHYGYFTASQGTKDATNAISRAEYNGQPHGTPIYFTVDYDAVDAEVRGNITTYMQAIKAVFANKGYPYKLGLYGSGLVLKSFKNTFTYSWLSASMGWQGSKDFKDYQIKQTQNGVIIGTGAGAINVDFDISNNAAGGWK